MAISQELQNAIEFHQTFPVNNCVSDTPTLNIPNSDKALRLAMIREEAREACEAIEESKDLAHIAKELADLQSVVYGAVVNFGLQDKWQAIMSEVHRSNMSKANPDGTVSYHPETGKVLKPETYSPADIESILNS